MESLLTPEDDDDYYTSPPDEMDQIDIQDLLFEEEALSAIEKENLRQLLVSGMPLDRIEQIIGDSKLVKDFAKKYIKEGGKNNDKTNLEDQELTIAGSLLDHQDDEFFEVVLNAIKNDETHEEYYDPIYFTIMKDPVVISSGFVLDRSSVIDANGKFQFEECPFSRKVLLPKAFPVTSLKSEIIDWTLKRFKNALNLSKGYIKNPNLAKRALEVSKVLLLDLGPSVYTFQAQMVSDLEMQLMKEHLSQGMEPIEVTQEVLSMYHNHTQNKKRRDDEILEVFVIYESIVEREKENPKWLEPLQMFVNQMNSNQIGYEVPQQYLLIILNLQTQKELDLANEIQSEEEFHDLEEDEFIDEIKEVELEGFQTNIELNEQMWYARGAKFENNGFLFQRTHLQVQNYVESKFTITKPCTIQAKMIARSDRDSFKEIYLFCNGKRDWIKISIVQPEIGIKEVNIYYRGSLFKTEKFRPKNETNVCVLVNQDKIAFFIDQIQMGQLNNKGCSQKGTLKFKGKNFHVCDVHIQNI